jgi:hypothetical protein
MGKEIGVRIRPVLITTRWKVTEKISDIVEGRANLTPSPLGVECCELVCDGFEDITAVRSALRETKIFASTVEEDSFCGLGNGVTGERLRNGVWGSISILIGGRH